MKKIKYLIFTLFSLILIPLSVNAASGKITVSGTSTVVVGNKVTVTVTLSSATSIGSWQMQLDYDKNYLKLTSATSEAGGVMMANSSTTGVKSKSYTFTFTTLKKGSTTVSVNSYMAYAYDDLSSMSLSSSAKKINIITQAELEASYSKNNNLKSLSVDGFEISPEFNKDTLEYSITVPEDTKEININASVEDGTASVTGAGVQAVSLGTNSFPIVVRAQNGGEKTYTLKVEVKDANPINVTVGETDYTIAKVREMLPSAPMYSEYTITIDGTEIPAYKNEASGIVLIGLKDTEGNVNLFIYNEENNTYEVYIELGINKLTVYPLKLNETLKGYTRGTIEYNGENIECLYISKDSNFVVIYGVNIETGDKEFYIYDKESQVISRYDSEYTDILNEKIHLYTYLIIGLSIIIVLLLSLMVFILKKKKTKKKTKKKKIPKKEEIKEDKNTIIEEDTNK